MSSASNTLGGGDQLVQTSPASTDVCVCVETETKPCVSCGTTTSFMICANECGAFACEECADRETHLCPECGEQEECYDYSKEIEASGVERRHTQMCADCFCGEKERKCEECECKFKPKDDDTFYVCAECWEEEEDDGPCERCGCAWCEADDEMGDHELFVSHKDGKNICRDCVWKEDEEE